MLGQILDGRYEIITQLAQGGFGATFLAHDHRRPGKPLCVVKQLKPLATDPYTTQAAKRLFIQEAEILERLGKHHQIPQLLAYFEKDIGEEREFYLVQEYIEGHDLHQELPPHQQLHETDVIKVLTEILEVLAFVHQEGVIHRDIKPANIRRRKSDGKIVLIDFGAVKEVKGLEVNQQGESRTVTIGTPGYMPSEQAKGQPKFSSDVYAVGVIGIQALTGLLPQNLVTDANTEEIIWRDRTQIAVSPKLAAILEKMVRYYFPMRYEMASAALIDLQKLCHPVKSRKLFNKITISVGLLAVIILATIIIFASKYISPATDLLVYGNSTYGIKIKYPQDWERQDINNIITGEVVTFLPPKVVGNNQFQEKVTISVENFTGTLEESSQSFRKEISNNLSAAKLIDEQSVTLANKQGKQLIFTGKMGTDSLKSWQIWTLKNDKAYIIIYTANIEDYEKFIPVAEQVVKSFEID
ncbi:MAG: protein kinase [Goleter apudmare HA4340-LM2]|jgi:serine/threonine-protein kinase|nr:protein kinase [Goleter apudmare HA4340-LM2]